MLIASREPPPSSNDFVFLLKDMQTPLKKNNENKEPLSRTMNVKSITQIIKNQHHNPIPIHNGKNNVAVAALNVRRVKAQVFK